MAFRDDHDALVEKAAALERELGEAQKTIATQREAIDQVLTLQTKVRELSSERDRLRGVLGPSDARRRWLLLALVIASFAFAGMLVQSAQRDRDEAVGRANAHAAVIDGQLSGARHEAEHAVARAQAAEERAADAERALARSRADDIAVPTTRETTIVRGTVASAPDSARDLEHAQCGIQLDRIGSECTAQVTCGDRPLYRTAPGMWFSCVAIEGAVLRAVDPDLLHARGQPRFDLDVARGSLRVAIPGGVVAIVLAR